METPQIRPGLVKQAESMPRVVVFFPNSALGNLAIQLLMQIGIPNDRLGVTPPEQIEGGQGMVLSIGCPDEKLLARVESICRSQGGRIHRQRALIADAQTFASLELTAMPFASSHSNALVLVAGLGLARRGRGG